MIGGLIIGPETAPDRSVIVRALGPSLSSTGISNPLADPNLTIVDVNGNVIFSNDSWQTNSSADQTTITQNGLDQYNGASIAAKEAIVVASLAPGNYTAIVSGSNNSTGVGLVEIYAITSP
jgi:hypothetical protein